MRILEKNPLILIFAMCLCMAPLLTAQTYPGDPLDTEPQAEQSSPEFLLLVGAMFESEEMYALAASKYLESANLGYANAQRSLGSLYSNGQGVLQDYSEAAKWYRLAAEQGLAEAQFDLAFLYYRGNGVLQDREEAAKWFRLSAEQGDVSAQGVLGTIYSTGDGVLQNYTEAFKWTRLAAEQGDKTAQHILGALYMLGEGVPHEYTSAHMWFNIATANGNTDAVESRQMVADLMTPSQIEQAQEMARNCLNSGYTDC